MRLQSAERWETLPGWARRFVLPACLLLAAAGVRSLLTRLIYPPGTFGIGSLSAWMDQAGVYARLQEFARFLRPFGLLHALALALVITRLLRRPAGRARTFAAFLLLAALNPLCLGPLSALTAPVAALLFSDAAWGAPVFAAVSVFHSAAGVALPLLITRLVLDRVRWFYPDGPGWGSLGRGTKCALWVFLAVLVGALGLLSLAEALSTFQQLDLLAGGGGSLLNALSLRGGPLRRNLLPQNLAVAALTVVLANLIFRAPVGARTEGPARE